MPHHLHHLTTEALATEKAQGKALRKTTPRSSHGDWQPAPDRPDPLKLLRAQDADRLERLLPIKYGRMATSPFAYLRGAAVVMAADLAGTPNTGLQVMLCGDAHVTNFGLFATPERDLSFDINDFDETFPGPWEWDLKRLAASIFVAARVRGFKLKRCRALVTYAASIYRQAMDNFAQMPSLDVWYYHVEAEDLVRHFKRASSKRNVRLIKQMVDKALSTTQAQTLDRMTTMIGGRRQFICDPPLLVPLGHPALTLVLTEAERQQITDDAIHDLWEDYLESLWPERRFLLNRYQIVDTALRVGGIGSVGTRCLVVLLEGRSHDDALILQIKETGPSALAGYLEGWAFQQEAERVVTGQRLMQATSDIFLGWHTSEASGSDYYWRQLKDMKGTPEIAHLDALGFHTYVAVCAWSLARAHARTGHAAAIRGYAGSGTVLDKALARFAEAYASQTERDHAALLRAIESGDISARLGV